jgi:hypothetical protein
MVSEETVLADLDCVSQVNNLMARFSHDERLSDAILDGVRKMHVVYAQRGWYDGHDLINWLDANRNDELNEIYDLYQNSDDPEMRADQQIGHHLYRLNQKKIGERKSPRRISKRSGHNRNGFCKVSVWEISPGTAVPIRRS